MVPEWHYRTPWFDEGFFSALEEARRWFEDDPCPDESIGWHLGAILDAFLSR
jgi:hypothetical protein